MNEGQSSTPDHHDDFPPREYLKQYYATPTLASDDVAIFSSMARWFSEQGRRFGTAVELGCGPTIHHAAPMVNWVDEIHLMDYLPGNLAEVRLWLDRDERGHDWSLLLAGLLDVQGRPADESAVKELANQLRAKITQLLHCDLHQSLPLGKSVQYELVTSFNTIECAAGDRDHWPQVVTNAMSLVAPGGALFLATMRNCSWYSVLGRRFPAAAITEADYAEILPRLGFPATSTQIEVVAVPDWAADGFDAIVIVTSQRSE